MTRYAEITFTVVMDDEDTEDDIDNLMDAMSNLVCDHFGGHGELDVVCPRTLAGSVRFGNEDEED